ncbi:MAG: hypothetical protein D0530_04840 [Methylococcales bacterium]|nr:MAG: hypothetical protein D0530_04840 [Methylococcales bacterium]
MEDKQTQFVVPEGPKPFVPEIKAETSIPATESGTPRSDVGDAAETEYNNSDSKVTAVASIDTRACPHCGLQYQKATALDAPSESDKMAWMRHILGEPRFTKEFVEMGGALKIVLRSRTTEENDQIFSQLEDEVKSGVIATAPLMYNPGYMLRMQRLMLVCSLKRTTPLRQADYPELVKAAEYKDADGKRRNIVVAHDLLINGMSEGLLSILLACQKRFDAICRTLIMHTTDENFWKPADGKV